MHKWGTRQIIPYYLTYYLDNSQNWLHQLPAICTHFVLSCTVAEMTQKSSSIKLKFLACTKNCFTIFLLNHSSYDRTCLGILSLYFLSFLMAMSFFQDIYKFKSQKNRLHERTKNNNGKKYIFKMMSSFRVMDKCVKYK